METSNLEGTAFDSAVEDHYLVAEQKCVEDVDGPDQRHTMEFGFHNRGVVGHSDVKNGREGKDWIQLMEEVPARKEDVTVRQLATMRHAAGTKKTEKRRRNDKKPRDL